MILLESSFFDFELTWSTRLIKLYIFNTVTSSHEIISDYAIHSSSLSPAACVVPATMPPMFEGRGCRPTCLELTHLWLFSALTPPATTLVEVFFFSVEWTQVDVIKMFLPPVSHNLPVASKVLLLTTCYLVLSPENINSFFFTLYYIFTLKKRLLQWKNSNMCPLSSGKTGLRKRVELHQWRIHGIPEFLLAPVTFVLTWTGEAVIGESGITFICQLSWVSGRGCVQVQSEPGLNESSTWTGWMEPLFRQSLTPGCLLEPHQAGDQTVWLDTEYLPPTSRINALRSKTNQMRSDLISIDNQWP